MEENEENEARQLIQEPLKGSAVQIDDAEVKSIINIAGRLPYFLQAVAERWLDNKEDGKAAIFESVVEQLSSDDNQVQKTWASYWKRLSIEEQSILREVAQGNGHPGGSRKDQRKLICYGFVAEHEGVLKIDSLLFKQWILNH